ncbi:uncharacterized protein LOC106883847 isoform X3 [Octopus bimaculoides]|uniref:uncharacterized protein LOC106883847 isoform X3 n=1 Tax=Octopus bimaculoides TaxID=37653 RepID=UPI0022E828A5|nr:uncharacterized protein LOC106883847 isoform X3 [Octopus bimaculoides]
MNTKKNFGAFGEYIRITSTFCDIVTTDNMLADPMETVGHLSFTTRSKRLRICGDGSTYNHRHNDVRGSGCKTLELQGVIDLLKQYDDYEGGVNCSICAVCTICQIHEKQK